MIVFIEKEIVLYTPPRCASVAMWEYFGMRGDALLIAGPDRKGSVNHHYSEPLHGYEGFKQLVVIRRPLERLCSLYRFKQIHGREQEFDTYIRVLSNFNGRSALHCDNQNRYLESVKHTGVIRYEELEEDLREAGLLALDEILPESNHGIPGSPSTSDLTERHINMLRPWWLPDCRRFDVEPM